MKLFLVGVKDRKAGVFTAPQAVVRLEAALRGFADEVNNPRNGENMWYRHPEDFELYHVGSFDDQVGRLEPLGDPVLLGCGDEYRKQQEMSFGSPARPEYVGNGR